MNHSPNRGVAALVRSAGFLAALSFAAPAASALDHCHQKLLAQSFYNPPFTYQDDENRIVGSTADMVREFLDKRGLEYGLEITAWKRIVRNIEDGGHVLVFNMGRTSEREDKFHWLLKLGTSSDVLITRNTPEMLSLTMEQATSGDYVAMCVAESWKCKALEDLGFTDILQVAGKSPTDRALMVTRNRADFFITGIDGLKTNLEASGLSPDMIAAHSHYRDTDSYLAAPKGFPQECLDRLLEAPAGE